MRACHPSVMRKLLLFLYDSESISDEEFLTFYVSYSSKNPDFPYSAYSKFDYDQIDKSECLAEFRVRKQDITLLADIFQLPVTIRCHQRKTCDQTDQKSTLYAAEAFLVFMLLFRHDSLFCKTSS